MSQKKSDDKAGRAGQARSGDAVASGWVKWVIPLLLGAGYFALDSLDRRAHERTRNKIEVDERLDSAWDHLGGKSGSTCIPELVDSSSIEKARRELRAAIDIDPNYARTYWIDATIKHLESEDPLPSLTKAVALDPSNGDVLIALSSELYQRDELSQSAEILAQAIELDPELDCGSNRLASIYYELREFEKSESVTRRAIELDRGNPTHYFNLGLALAARNFWDKAAEAFKTATTLDPDSYRARFNLGWSYKMQGRMAEAVNEYMVAIRINPRDPYLQELAHTFDFHYQDPALAEQFFHQLISSGNRSPYALAGLGSAMLKMRKFEEAIGLFEQAVAIDPGCAECFDRLGIAFDFMGEFDEAVACFERAVEIEPSPCYYWGLYIALVDAGRAWEARKLERDHPFSEALFSCDCYYPLEPPDIGSKPSRIAAQDSGS